MLPTLGVASLAVLVHLVTQPPYAGFGQPFSIPSPKVQSGLVFVPLGQVLTQQPSAMACGMTIVRPERDVDPKIVIDTPKNADYKIRIIEPQRCR